MQRLVTIRAKKNNEVAQASESSVRRRPLAGTVRGGLLQEVHVSRDLDVGKERPKTKARHGKGTPGLEIRMSLCIASPIWRPGPLGVGSKRGEQYMSSEQQERPAHGGRGGHAKDCRLHSRNYHEPTNHGWEYANDFSDFLKE